MVVVCLLLFAGCTSVAPMQVAYSPNHAGVVQPRTSTEVHEAKACRSALLFVFPMGDASLNLAMQELPESTPGKRLAWVTVDERFTQYFFATKTCTVVTAHYLVGGGESLAGVDLFDDSDDVPRGEAVSGADLFDNSDEDGHSSVAHATSGVEQARENGSRPKTDTAEDVIWLGSIAALYESRAELAAWRLAHVDIQMKNGEQLSGRVLRVQEANVVLMPEEGTPQRIDLLEAEWIRRAQ